jgi:hypothetical protein
VSDADNIPDEIEEREDTGVVILNERVENAKKITMLYERLQALKERTPSREDVRREVTGARDSIVAKIAPMASKESLDSLSKKVDEQKPPGFWPLVAGLFGAALIIGGIIWQASARISDLATANTILKLQLDTLDQTVKRVEAAETKIEAKVDSILIHQGKAP